MKIKVKKVYYCDYCKKHGLSASSILNHEKHCTLNPKRECGGCKDWRENIKQIKYVEKHYKILQSHKDKDSGGITRTFVAEFEDKIKDLADKVDCPFCMLAILRQSNTEKSWANYNYKEEVEKHWERKNEEAQQDEMDEMRYEFESSQL